ncbi:MAG: sulfatase-like hydrolase/transferase, partial [Deltaproteobacteria bacterium]|nr:sulfatase-like hydrolase/transferase [Deltaproteobacteria bacterium]
MKRLCFLIMAFLSMLSLTGCGERPAPRPNVILITVDTLRADRLGCYGNSLGLTPSIDALARRSARFAAAYASAPSTFPSVVSLLTGNHPESSGAVNNYGFLPPDVPTIAGHLRGMGWRTAAVVSNYVLSERAGLGAGFDRYDATFPQTEAVWKNPERIAAETRSAALALVDSFDRGSSPLFLWVHFQDPHGPYVPPDDLADRYLEAERAAPDGQVLLPLSNNVRGLGGIPTYQVVAGRRHAAEYRAAYDGEVRYADAEIG